MGRQAQIKFNVKDKMISKKHTEIKYIDGCYWIRDFAKAATPVFFNITHQFSILLKPNMVIYAGEGATQFIKVSEITNTKSNIPREDSETPKIITLQKYTE